MADEAGMTSEVARVLEIGHAWYEATVAYHRAVEEAFRPLLAMDGPGETKETGREVGISPQIASGVGEPKRRLRACVENWPDAETGEYDPSCCRFPKSRSATVYDEEHVTEGDLEPRTATQEPAGGARDGSAGRGASGGLGERLRALGTGQTRALRKELRAMADEAERLEAERDDLSAALKRVCFGDMRGIKWGGEEWTNTADIRAAIEGTAAEKNENEEAP